MHPAKGAHCGCAVGGRRRQNRGVLVEHDHAHGDVLRDGREKALSRALGRDEASYPGLMAHYDRMMARPAVEQTIAIESKIGYEFPLGAGTR